MYVQAAMAKYGPPYASAEEGEEGEEEETIYRLYLKIEHKLKRVHLELEESGMHGECLI